jgi:hypothetical protein
MPKETYETCNNPPKRKDEMVWGWGGSRKCSGYIISFDAV